jgi:hypothetical protein
LLRAPLLDAAGELDLLPPPRDELSGLKAARNPERAERVFTTTNGREDSPSALARSPLSRLAWRSRPAPRSHGVNSPQQGA